MTNKESEIPTTEAQLDGCLETAVISGAVSTLVIIIELLGFIDPGIDVVTRILLLPVILVLSLLGTWLYRNYDESTSYGLRLIMLAIMPIAVGLVFLFVYYVYSFNYAEVNHVFPSVRRFLHPLPSVSTYATNAQVEESQLYATSAPIGPRYFLRLRFHMFCDENQIDCNAGWILSNLRGFDASNYGRLVFAVRGREGGEQFGVGLKDTYSTEVKIFDVGEFMPPTGRVITDWKQVEIPLEQFITRNVQLSSLDNISFFVDAQHTDARTIQFDIANLQLRE